MYFELDGSFPNHEANPLDPANLVDLQKAVPEHGADIGLAFDGDADRVFVVDERGEPVSPSAVTALVAVRELAKGRGTTIIHNLITSRAVPEIVREHGGSPVRTRVGHSFIKAEMARTDAVFGGEHSAHYYFRDFWRADTGMLAAMHVLAALGEQGRTLSELTAAYSRYSASGEINSTVADAAASMAAGARYLRRTGRSHRGRPRRPDGRAARRRVVQPARQQHRAPAAAQRGGPGRGAHGCGARPGARDGAVVSGAGGATHGPLGLDPDLLAILACPDTHHSPLTVDEQASELLCTTCDRAFPVRDGIPVLLLDEARHRGGGVGGRTSTP